MYRIVFGWAFLAFTLCAEEDDFVFEDIDTPVRVVEFNPPLPPSKGLTLEIPVLGEVVFESAQPPQEGLQAQIPRLLQKKVLGPLVIESGTFALVGGKLSYLAQGTLFDKAIKVGLKEFGAGSLEGTAVRVTRAQFGIDFLEKPYFEVMPGKTVAIESADILVEQQKPVILRLKFEVFKQKIIASMSISQSQIGFGFDVPRLSLGELIPSLASMPVGGVVLSDVQCTFDAIPVGRGSGSPQATVRARADFSSLGWAASKKQAASQITCTLGKETVSCQATIDALDVPVVGTIPQAIFSIEKQPGAPVQVKLALKGTLDIPSIGKTEIDFEGDASGKNLVLTGLVRKAVDMGGIDIESMQVALDTGAKKYSIQADGKVVGSPARLSMQYEGVSGAFTVAGDLLTKEPVKPFEKMGIAELRGVALENPQLRITKGKQNALSVSIKGSVAFKNMIFDGTLFITSVDGKRDVYVELSVPSSWKISQLIPEAKNTPVDMIVFKEVSFILTPRDFTDEKRKILFRQGINIYAVAVQEGVLEKLAQVSDSLKDQQITFFGALAVPVNQSVLKGNVPVSIPLKTDKVILNNLGIELAFSPVAISLDGTLRIKPTSKDTWLDLTASIGVGPQDAQAKASMQGEWKNPFGARFSLQDVACELGINYELLLTTGLPDTIGLTGSFLLADRTVTMAGKGSFTRADQLVLAGSLDKLELEDIVALASKIINKKISIDKLPQIGIDKVKFYLVPQATKIGVFSYDQGFSAQGLFHVPRFEAQGKITITSDGVTGEGYASPLVMGDFMVTGAGLDRVYGTPDDGPVMSIILTPFKQEVYLTGLVQMKDLFKGTTDVYLGIDKFTFSFDTKIKNLFDAYVRGEIGLLAGADVILHIGFQSDFLNFLNKEISASITKFQQQAQNDLIKAQRDLEPVQKKYESFMQQIDSLQKRLDELNANVDNQSGIAKATVALEQSPEYIKISGEISGLGIAAGPTKAAYEVAKGVLEGFKKVSYYGIGEGGKLITKNILQSFQLNQVYFDGSARQIVGGVMPSLTLEITLFGTKHLLKNVQFDFNNSKQSAQAIADAIVAFIKGS